jgi:hypothetical protein
LLRRCLVLSGDCLGDYAIRGAGAFAILLAGEHWTLSDGLDHQTAGVRDLELLLYNFRTVKMEGGEMDLCVQKMPSLLKGSGVYFLLQGKRVVYVGQSKRVSHRIAEHLKTKRFDRVVCLPLAPEDLLKAEAFYIAMYAPIYNLQLGDEKRTAEMLTTYRESNDLLAQEQQLADQQKALEQKRQAVARELAKVRRRENPEQ